MLDKKTRLLEAERALHSLEIQIEQYSLHLEELVGQPYETEKARVVLDEMTTERELQKKYCDLLANAELDEDLCQETGRAWRNRTALANQLEPSVDFAVVGGGEGV